MKKVLLIGILVLAIVASVVTGTLAVYSVSLDEISGDAVAKEFAISQEGDWDFNEAMKIAPTEKLNLSFTISNKDGNIVSEVPMDVSIKAGLREISKKTAIPYLTFKLYDEYDKLLGSFDGGIGEVKHSFYLPLSATEVVKAFRMEIEWVSHSDDVTYQGNDNANRVYVQVSASQSVGEPDEEEIIFNAAGYNGGSGTSSDPYIISTREAFLKMVAQKSGDRYVAVAQNQYYKLTKDLDLGVLDSTVKLALYNSVLDGNGHYIKFVSTKPLFSRLDGGTIQNLTIKDYTFDGVATRDYGNTNMAALVDCISSEAGSVLIKNVVMENCSITNNNNNYVGGLAARVYAYNPIVVEDCFMRGVKINTPTTSASSGMFFGVIRREIDSANATVTLKNCYAVDYVDGDKVVKNDIHVDVMNNSTAGNVSKVASIETKTVNGAKIPDGDHVLQIWFDGMTEPDIKADKGLSYKTTDGVYLFNVTRTYGPDHMEIPNNNKDKDITLTFSFEQFNALHNA